MNVDDRRLGEIAVLPEDHPDRVAFCRDPHQRTLLNEYLRFLEAEPAEGSSPEVAREALGRFLDDQVGVPRTVPTRSPAPRPHWLGRIAVGAAAVAILVVGLQLGHDTARTPSHVLRGGSSESIALDAPRIEEGRVEFSWGEVPGADGYVLVITSADLSEAFRSDPVAAPALSVALDEIAARGECMWRVHAYSQGDEVERSSAGALVLP